jgi:hypothetical protein
MTMTPGNVFIGLIGNFENLAAPEVLEAFAGQDPLVVLRRIGERQGADAVFLEGNLTFLNGQWNLTAHQAADVGPAPAAESKP